MQQLQFHFLGGVRINRGDASVPLPTPQRTALLAYLLTFGDRLHARAVLAGLFWGELSDDSARRYLSDAIYRLRKQIEPDNADPSLSIFGGDVNHVGLNPQAKVWIDVQEFLRLTAPGATLEQQLDALDLYQGDFLPGVYDDWVLLERERLATRYRETLTRLLTHYQNSGALDQALEMARRLVASDPLQEDANRTLMRLYYRAGRRDRALLLYQALRQKLAEELEVEPEPATTELVQTIQAGVSTAEELDPPAGHTGTGRVGPQAADEATSGLIQRLRNPPLLGRDAERRRLADWLALPRSAVTPMVLLEGEAGVGKSRLAAEVADEAYRQGMAVLRGRYHEMAAPLPYSGLVEALRTGLRLAGPPPLEEVWLIEVSRLLPELATWHPNLPPPVPLPPDQERLRLSQALVQYLLALANTGPHVIIMEDVHWIDPSALDLLQYMLPRLPGSGFRLLATARSEDLADRQDVLDILDGLESNHILERIPVPRLGADTIIELVRYAIDQRSRPAVFGQRLWQETEGNPYFALETLRLWAERGLLVPMDGGNWRIAGATIESGYAELPTPASVRRVLAQRVRRLDGAARTVLEVGSVLGDLVNETLLWRTSGSAPEAVLAPAEELLRRHLWIEQPGGYAFAHAKVREVVYESISGPRKRHLHRLAASALEAEHPDNIEALAHHYYLAEDWARALPYLLDAAERAQRSVAYRQAVLYYEQAMHALDHLAAGALTPAEHWERRFTILTERARLYHNVGRLEEARSDYDSALRLTEEHDDCSRRALARNMRARFLLEQGRLEEVLSEARQALIEARAGAPDGEGLPASRVEAQIFSTLSRVYLRTGENAEGIAAEKQALDYYRAVGDLRGEADSLTQYASLLGRHGNIEEAKSLLHQALEQARRLGERPLEARILNNLGLFTQAPEETYQLIQRYLDVGEAIGDLRAQRTGHANLAELLLRFGRYDEAQAHAEQTIALSESLNDPHSRAEAIIQRGRAWQAQGEYGQARADITLGLGLLQGVGAQLSVMWGLLELSRLMLDEAQWSAVPANVEKSYQIWQTLNEPYGHRFASLFHAIQAQAQLGLRRGGQARSLVHVALAALEDPTAPELVGWVDTSVEVLARCYKVLAVTGPPDEARALLEHAHARLEVVAARCGPLLRQSYLENVPECRTIRAAWTEHAVPDDKTAGHSANGMSKGAFRRKQILLLIQDAQNRGETCDEAMLARQLGVHARTIQRDLAALRDTGRLP
jgi:DNA-binding SARP family transcriptional activator/predicted ATPase